MAPTLKAFVRRLRNLGIAAKSKSEAFPPQHLLPIELWETVFLQLSDTELLHAATICAAFNVLCIHIFLGRNIPGITGAAHLLFYWPHSVLNLQSHMLAAIHLSFRPLQLELLTCYFRPSNIRRDLRLMENLIPRCTALRQLTMTFHDDLLRIDSVEPSPSLSREALTTALCAAISTMAMRVVGPVIVFSGSGTSAGIFSCQPVDVASWGLNLTQFNLTLGQKIGAHARRMLKLTENPVPAYRWSRRARIRLHNGIERRVHAPPKLLSVRIWSIPSEFGSPRCFTIVVFNSRLITRLHLSEDRGGDSIPVVYLNAVVVHVILPCLQEVNMSIDGIDPTALGFFLSRHPSVKEFNYEGYGDESVSRQLVEPPLAHSGLRTISVQYCGKASTGRLIPALASSPNLHNVILSIKSDLYSPANLTGFAMDLEFISLRPTGIHLQLDLLDSFLFPTEEFSDAARKLDCVRTVGLYGEPFQVSTILPWVALLPGVVRVGVTINFLFYRFKTPSPTDEQMASEFATFSASARLALAHVPDLIIEQWGLDRR